MFLKIIYLYFNLNSIDLYIDKTFVQINAKELLRYICEVKLVDFSRNINKKIMFTNFCAMQRLGSTTRTDHQNYS